MPRTQFVWRFKKQEGFLHNQLLGSYSNKMFRDQMRVNKQAFSFLCETLGPNIKKFDTPMTTNVDLERRIVVTLARLAIGNTLSMIGDSYGIPYYVSYCSRLLQGYQRSFVAYSI